jgi:hypothetical protein
MSTSCDVSSISSAAHTKTTLPCVPVLLPRIPSVLCFRRPRRRHHRHYRQDRCAEKYENFFCSFLCETSVKVLFRRYTRQNTFWFLNRYQKPHVARHKNARAHIVHEPHNFTALLPHNDGRSILCLGDRVWKKYTKGKKTGFQKKKRHTTQNTYVMLKVLSAYCTS